MNKFLTIVLVSLALFSMQAFAATSNATVNVVVVGMISHGPMQPTIDAIKNVTAKYGDRVSVTWFDLGTLEGAKYAQDHQLSAHLNILINGKYQFSRNGKDITFQWFEGQQWTKEDLDAVISDALGVPVTEAPGGQSGFSFPLVAGTALFAILLVGGWFIISRKKVQEA